MKEEGVRQILMNVPETILALLTQPVRIHQVHLPVTVHMVRLAAPVSRLMPVLVIHVETMPSVSTPRTLIVVSA